MPSANPDRGSAARRRLPLKLLPALLALVVTIAMPGLVFAWSGNSYSSADEALLVQLTNQARAAAGLKALKVDPALASMARWRSKDMATRNYFSHSIPPDGKMVFDYLSADGYCYTVAGENIGKNNFPDDIATQAIQTGFMNSDGHRANILGTGWDAIGVGAYKRSDGQHYWTVLFAARCSTAPAPTPKATPKPTPKATVVPTPRPTLRPTPRPTIQPTVRPTAVTLEPTASPELTLDPTATPEVSVGPSIPPTAEPTSEPTSAPTPTPERSAVPDGASLGLQILDRPVSNDLVDTIVADVAGAYFGN